MDKPKMPEVLVAVRAYEMPTRDVSCHSPEQVAAHHAAWEAKLAEVEAERDALRADLHARTIARINANSDKESTYG